MKKKLVYLSVATLIITLFACNKTFLNETPSDVLAPESLYTTKAGFESGLYGIYNLIRQERAGLTSKNPINYPEFVPMVIGVDNAYGNFPDNLEKIYNGFGVQSNPADSNNSHLCANLYQIVNAANTIIFQANNNGIQWTTTDKNQILGEAMIARAWAYRHISFLWGAMPLVTSPSAIRTDWVRTPVSQIRAQMEQDLLFAEANCSETAPVEGRFTKAVATHYLAELYLTTGQYDKARDKALSLINGGHYRLVTQRYGVSASKPGTPFTDMFISGNSNYSQGNTEAIWTIENAYYTANIGGDYNIMRRCWVNRYDQIPGSPVVLSVANGGRGLGREAPTKYALSLYTQNDDRGSASAWRWYWIINNKSNTIGKKVGDTLFNDTTKLESLKNYYWPSTTKWDWADSTLGALSGESSQGNDQIYLRLGETYLFLAEAYFKLGDNANAASTINILRDRAHAPHVSAGDITQDFILDERSRELFSEEHRRYTLLRMGGLVWYSRTQKYNAIAGPNIQLRDTLLPVPQTVINANLTLAMPQNPGF